MAATRASSHPTPARIQHLPRPGAPSRAVAVVSESPIAAAGIRDWIGSAHGRQIVGRPGLDPEPALVVMICGRPDPQRVAVMSRRSRGPVLVLCQPLNAEVEAQLLRAGAAAALPATTTRAAFLEVLEALLGGRSVVSLEAVRLLACSADPATLTVRQRQLLELLALGLPTREIAQVMVVSESTVKTHVARLTRRYGLSGRAALIAHAQRLLDDDGAPCPAG